MNSDYDTERLQKIIDAKRWQVEWLRSYVNNGGSYYDTTLKRLVSKEDQWERKP